jgi:hypothetical protein
MFRRRERSAVQTLKPGPASSNQLEALEARRLMSTAALPDYTTFKHTTGLAFNGYGTSTIISKHSIQLTDGVKDEARSFWYTAKVSISSFDTTFSFISTKSDTSADGLTFTIQPYGVNSIGSDGHDLGYTGINRSVGVSFNLFNYMNFGSRFSFDKGGAQPASNVVPGNIDLHDGDQFTCTLIYNGTTLSMRLVDDGNPADVFTDSETINIVKELGVHSAYVGFTGATGTYFSTQKIESWTYGYGPTVTSISASPSTVTKHVSVLTADATDPLGTKDLTYTWAEVAEPAGARHVTYSTNGTTADDTTVTVFSDGTYTFQVTVEDQDGFTATDDVNIVKT